MGEGQVRDGKESRNGQRAAEPVGLGLEEYPVVILFKKHNHPRIGPATCSGGFLNWLESKE